MAFRVRNRSVFRGSSVVSPPPYQFARDTYPNAIDELGQPIFSSLYNHVALRPGAAYKDAPGKPIRARLADTRSAVRVTLFKNVCKILKSPDVDSCLIVTDINTRRWIAVSKWEEEKNENAINPHSLLVILPSSPLKKNEQTSALGIFEHFGGGLLESEVVKGSHGEDVRVCARYQLRCGDGSRLAADVLIRVLTEVYGLACQTPDGLTIEHQSD